MARSDSAVVPGLRTVTAMVSVYVLRLRPEDLAEGRIVGQAEHVASGDNAPIRSADELVDLLVLLAQRHGDR